MINRLVHFALHQRVLVLIGALGLAARVTLNARQSLALVRNEAGAFSFNVEAQ